MTEGEAQHDQCHSKELSWAWRPIDTYDKDEGGVVLVGCYVDDGGGTEYWQAQTAEWIKEEGIWVTEWVIQELDSDEEDFGVEFWCGAQPTHWMPKPEGPDGTYRNRPAQH